ncbi:MAG: LLM class F420-dependent oxidoreductase [Acidimicrobiia bacterium]|nr:LLM class F420-dependent oxidoreductase [Acidimicrobiia bacterium]
MRVGFAFANAMANAEPAMAVEFAQAAESAGFESLWTVEHVLVPADYESTYPYNRRGRMAGPEDQAMPDPIVWLTHVAAHTERIMLGTGIVILPLRRPPVLAKQAASLQVISGGRFLLGVGAGWLQEEFDAIDVPFEDRGDRTDDHIQALRALWEQELATFHGTHTRFEDVYSRPRPPSPIPIVIGGHSKRAARRAGELGDGFFPGRVIEDELQGLLDRVRETAEAAGRDPDGIEITLGARPDPEQIEERFAAGADRVVVPSQIGVDGVEMLGKALGLA